jgi:hypothetical protein
VTLLDLLDEVAHDSPHTPFGKPLSPVLGGEGLG